MDENNGFADGFWRFGWGYSVLCYTPYSGLTVQLRYVYLYISWWMRCGTSQRQIDGDPTVSPELHESCDVSPTFFRLLIFLDRQMDDMSVRHFSACWYFWTDKWMICQSDIFPVCWYFGRDKWMMPIFISLMTVVRLDGLVIVKM